jgi:hypothetical protein
LSYFSAALGAIPFIALSRISVGLSQSLSPPFRPSRLLGPKSQAFRLGFFIESIPLNNRGSSFGRQVRRMKMMFSDENSTFYVKRQDAGGIPLYNNISPAAQRAASVPAENRPHRKTA